MELLYSIRETIDIYDEFRKDGNIITDNVINKFTLEEFLLDITKPNQVIQNYQIIDNELTYPKGNVYIPIDIDRKRGLYFFINDFYPLFKDYLILQKSRSYEEKHSIHAFLIFDNSKNEIDNFLKKFMIIINNDSYDKSIYGFKRFLFTSSKRPEKPSDLKALTISEFQSIIQNSIYKKLIKFN